MSKRKIRVGSRDSKLAVLQTQMVIDAIAEKNPDMEFELVTMKTTGDRILDRTLEKSGGKGLFVKELDSALLQGEVDITVHSLKDVPMEVDDRIPLLAYFKRGNPYDALVLPKTVANVLSEASLASYFAENTKPIGSSSSRRRMQMAEIVDGAELEPVRGNVITRLEKLDGGSYSALILAGAGLERLGLQGRISMLFDEKTMIPAAGQGILAVQGRRGENYDYLKSVDDYRTRLEALAERTFVKALGGDCSSPIGCRAEIETTGKGGRIKMWGFHGEANSDIGEKVFCEESFKTEEDIIDVAEKLVKKVKGKRGKVYLVGAGPGDIGLLTLRAKELLEEADVIVFDRLVGDSILGLVSGAKKKLIDVGKSAGKHKVDQEEINRILLREALAGNDVVRLKGGDPFVFGRGGEELELLCENGVEFEIVPGITSAVAVAAYNGIPVTHREYSSSFHVITAHKKAGCETEIDYASLVKLNSTLIFLMGLTSVGRICDGLLAAGMDEAVPAAVLSRGTTAGQSRLVATVGNLAEELKNRKFESPAIIVVGSVCSLAEKFAWAERKPLWGRKIAVMRPKDRNSSLVVELRKLGAEVVEMPAITTEAIETPPEFIEKVNEVRGKGMIVFTSPFGVKVFFEKMIESGLDIRTLADTEFAAIGSATQKEIENRGIFVDIVPEDYSAKSLGELLADKSKKEKKKILIPRAEQGSEDLIEPLERENIEFVDMPIYRTLEIFDKQVSVYDDSFDLAAFTSASSVKAFCKANEGYEAADVTAVCIGEKTAQEAERAGMNVFVAESATIDSLTEKIVEVCGC